MISDIIHNVMDGIAIGAAFSKSPVVGLSTSVAVAFHEIPHEIGDFAALIHSGVSWRAAVFWNMVFSVIAFIGLYCGIAESTTEAASQWVFIFTAGIFLHHSLSEFVSFDQFKHFDIWKPPFYFLVSRTIANRRPLLDLLCFAELWYSVGFYYHVYFGHF